MLHRTDAKHNSCATELSRHFHDSPNCDFDGDLDKQVLQNVNGDKNNLEFYDKL